MRRGDKRRFDRANRPVETKGGGVISKIWSLRRERDAAARESGQALVEYTLILIVIAFVTFAALQAIGTSVTGALFDAAAGFGGA